MHKTDAGYPVALTDLAALWRVENLSVHVPGYGGLASDLWTLHRFRGALGTALARGASPAALRGEPCPFLPPCGFSLFHGKVDWASGAQDIRPLVLTMDNLAGDLVLGVRLYGMACDWAPEFRAAMVAACAAGLDGGGGTRHPLPVSQAESWPGELPRVPLESAALHLTTLTPLVQKDGGAARPRLVLTSLIAASLRRISQLAQVHGVDTGWTRPMMAAFAQSVAEGAVDQTRPSQFPRGRSEGRRRTAHVGTIRFAPIRDPATAAFWQLAVSTHLGADSAGGAGRIALSG